MRRALEELRQSLPDTIPLSGLSICAVGERVVVRDGKARWQVDDGQYVLALDVDVEGGELRVVERPEPATRRHHRRLVRQGSRARNVGPERGAQGL